MSQNELRALFIEWFSSPHPRIKHFTGAELIETSRNVKKGVHNSVPPIHLWSNILPTVQLLDAVRKELGYPLYLTSTYRNPAFNEAVGSTSGSMHLKFNALDFYGKRGNPGEWFEAVMKQRINGMEVGGIGLYSTFVHIDTRTLWKGRTFSTW